METQNLKQKSLIDFLTPLKSLCLLLVCITFATNAQPIIIAENYTSYTPEMKTPLFIENFNNNNNNWYLGIKENVWYENIQDSVLYFQSYESVAKEDYKDVIINPAYDFEIELKLRLDKGIQNKFYGLQWGKSASDSKQFDFFINGQGQFTIDKYTGSFHDFVPVTSSNLINNYTYNTLTVRKSGLNYYFFINKQLVHKMPFEPMFGNGVGFQVAENSSVQIDYLYVWKLASNADNTLPVINISDAIYTCSSGTIKGGETVSMKFTVENSSQSNADNLKLRYNLPQSVMLLESKTDIQLPSATSKEIELIFYINKDVDTENITANITIEGAELKEGNSKNFSLALNQTVEGSTSTNKKLALYRSSNDPLKGLGAAKAMQEVAIGNYYALIIGIDKYSGEWKPLKNAVNDAKAVEQQLRTKYEFQSIRTLYNEQATRANIIKEYEWLMANIKANDNLLIYYSGHGDYNDKLQRGFWVPVDAQSSSISALIANTDIQAFLSGIKSKHTFLIADACFSGDIFRGKTLTIPYENSFKYYNQIYSKPSRTALTSGGVEPVMDGGKDGHSVFAYYLLKSLTNNENKFFDASQLYNDLKVAVINNSNQTPGFSPIVNTGDEGGQFIFIKK